MLRQFIEAGENGQLDQFDDVIAADAVDHNPFPGQAPGSDGVKQIFAMLMEAFPDLRSPVVALAAEGDKVAAVQRLRGTHHGTFMGAPPTGKSFDVAAIDWVRASGGKFVEHWGLIDQADLLTQLGMMPTTASVPTQRRPLDAETPRGAVGAPEDNKALMKYALGCINDRDMDGFLSLIHQDAVDHTPVPGQAPGRAGWKQRLQKLAGAFSGTTFVLEDQISEIDLVSGRYRFAGLHTGDLMGAPATGKPFAVSAIDMVRIRDGRIVEHWGLFDMPELMSQLGLAPEAPPS
jgi:steroid delta-isomerase-like uncharacterized protein